MDGLSMSSCAWGVGCPRPILCDTGLIVQRTKQRRLSCPISHVPSQRRSSEHVTEAGWIRRSIGTPHMQSDGVQSTSTKIHTCCATVPARETRGARLGNPQQCKVGIAAGDVTRNSGGCDAGDGAGRGAIEGSAGGYEVLGAQKMQNALMRERTDEHGGGGQR